MPAKKIEKLCQSYIPDGSLCCNGMVRCCGLTACIRQYPALQYSYWQVYGNSYCNGQFPAMFKEATGMTVEEYHTPAFWGRTFVKRRNGTVEIK